MTIDILNLVYPKKLTLSSDASAFCLFHVPLKLKTNFQTFVTRRLGISISVCFLIADMRNKRNHKLSKVRSDQQNAVQTAETDVVSCLNLETGVQII